MTSLNGKKIIAKQSDFQPVNRFRVFGKIQMALLETKLADAEADYKHFSALVKAAYTAKTTPDKSLVEQQTLALHRVDQILEEKN